MLSLLLLAWPVLAQQTTQPANAADNAANAADRTSDRAADSADRAADRGARETDRAADRADRDANRATDRADRDADRMRDQSDRDRIDRDRMDRDREVRSGRESRELNESRETRIERDRDRDVDRDRDRNWSSRRESSGGGCAGESVSSSGETSEGEAVYYGTPHRRYNWRHPFGYTVYSSDYSSGSPCGCGGERVSETAENREEFASDRAPREIRGEIVTTRVETIRNDRHLIARVRTEEGRTEIIDLGPERFMRDRDIQFRDGEQINVRAFRADIDGRSRLLADRFENNGRWIDINRDQEMRLQGQPVSPGERERMDRNRSDMGRNREMNRDRNMDRDREMNRESDLNRSNRSDTDRERSDMDRERNQSDQDRPSRSSSGTERENRSNHQHNTGEQSDQNR